MIHYHGANITPQKVAATVLTGAHAFISFVYQSELSLAINVAQSFAVDNGAFSHWRRGQEVTDWTPFYSWVDGLRRIPSFDFAVIPDAIEGGEEENDALVAQWPWQDARWVGAPVWHMHESLKRLERLASMWPRVCIGSSGDFSAPGSVEWWGRIGEAMGVVCDRDGLPHSKLHGLRMLAPDIFTHIPLASADSTNVARNHGIDKAWRGPYAPPTLESRALVLRQRIEAHQSPPRWEGWRDPRCTGLFAPDHSVSAGG